VRPALQKTLGQALAAVGLERVRLPAEFGKVCASHAHLGHIDVQPCLCMIKDRAENKGEWKRCEFWARRVDKDSALWRIEGQSEVASELSINGAGVHDVKLSWEGFLEMKGDAVTRLWLYAHGTEKLQFANDHPLRRVKKDEVAFLPAGRPIDWQGDVRYGVIGEPGK
jgi:hypothetical protein